jgi:demethylmenaquinone methyltransferase / 2-methoxy-6-polyprenyl-1,4-benzoquinol methylase
MTTKDDFGFKKVDKEKKQRLVNNVFSSVASSYDLMNDVMSAGVHRLWKNRLIELLPSYNGYLLDVAGGTGDVIERFHKETSKKAINAKAVICDISEEMLSVGKKKLIDSNNFSGVSWCCGNAEELPFADNSFDYYTIAFGIRNLTNIDKALKEAHRVLKNGGKFLCLEFSQVENNYLSVAYDFYSMNVIPMLGDLITGDKESYQYLVESIRMFPDKEKFADMIDKAGFSKVNYESLSFGITTIHSGWKE